MSSYSKYSFSSPLDSLIVDASLDDVLAFAAVAAEARAIEDAAHDPEATRETEPAPALTAVLAVGMEAEGARTVRTFEPAPETVDEEGDAFVADDFGRLSLPPIATAEVA